MFKLLNDMSAKEKNAIMKGVIKDYKESKAKYDLLVNKEFYPSVDFNTVRERRMSYNNTEVKLINYMKQKEELHQMITYYDAIIQQLDDRSREILQNDFMKNDTMWWVDCYSKSSYYRARRKAIDNFLAYLID